MSTIALDRNPAPLDLRILHHEVHAQLQRARRGLSDAIKAQDNDVAIATRAGAVCALETLLDTYNEAIGEQPQSTLTSDPAATLNHFERMADHS